MPDFAPVFLDEPLDRRLRQTWLRHFNNCPRSAYLAAKYNGEDQTREMVRGTAAHEVFKRATALMMSRDEPTVPPDVVKDLTDQVLGELPVPLEEHDYVREMAFRWGSEIAIDPGMVIACESLFEMEIGDWRVRARIDFAELLENDRAVVIRDYKTSRHIPAWDEIARKIGGRLIPKNFQLVLYALLVRFGVPVGEVECPVCSGKGYTVSVGPPGMSDRLPCRSCGGFDPYLDLPPNKRVGEVARMGSGVIETPEPFGLATGVDRFDLEFVYPGVEDREGRMVRRPMSLERLELDEYKASLEGLVARVAAAEQSGDWPAVVSDEACSECPAPGECPIPREVRDWRGRINTPEQASDAARVLDRQKAELRAAQTELRNFAKVSGEPIRFDGKVMEFVYSESESMDWRAFLAAPADADPQAFVSTRGKTDFKSRDLTAEEREAQDV